MNVTRPITIPNKEVTTRYECYVSRVPAIVTFVFSRFRWSRELPYQASIEVSLGNYATINIADVKELFRTLFPKIKTMSTSSICRTKRLDELPFLIVNTNGIFAYASRANRMSNINPSLRIRCDTVSISKLQVHRWSYPIMDYLVSMFALTRN